jgi:acetyltransferase-like isoleucine patch superfamily enzyme
VAEGERSRGAPASLRVDERAPGLLVGDDVEIGDGVSFGAHVVVHAGTVIGDGCVIEDHAVLGKRPRLASTSAAHGEVPRLELGARVSVGVGAIVFAGARLGEGVIVGDQAFVRERCTIGAGSLIGRGSVVDNDVALGARVRVQTNVYLSATTLVEDDVFIGPGVTTANDHTMSRHPPAEPLRGAILRRACRVGAGAVLVPGVEIGAEAFVAAAALVTRDVEARAVVMGVPARAVRAVPDGDLLERWR